MREVADRQQPVGRRRPGPRRCTPATSSRHRSQRWRRHSSGQVTPTAWTRRGGTVWLRVSSQTVPQPQSGRADATRKSQSSSTRRTGCCTTPITAVTRCWRAPMNDHARLEGELHQHHRAPRPAANQTCGVSSWPTSTSRLSTSCRCRSCPAAGGPAAARWALRLPRHGVARLGGCLPPPGRCRRPRPAPPGRPRASSRSRSAVASATAGTPAAPRSSPPPTTSSRSSASPVQPGQQRPHHVDRLQPFQRDGPGPPRQQPFVDAQLPADHVVAGDQPAHHGHRDRADQRDRDDAEEPAAAPAAQPLPGDGGDQQAEVLGALAAAG